MGIFNLFDRFKASTSDRSPWGDFFFEPVSVRSVSGMRVSADSAMRLAAVYACVRILSETMASLPLVVYRARADGGKDRVTDHWLYRLLGKKPNRYQNPFEWREMLQGHLALRGNAFCQILANGRGEITELIPIHPDRVRMELLAEGDYRYRIQNQTGHELVLPRGEVWHLRGLSSDGLLGLSPIELSRESLGMALAAQDYGAEMIGAIWALNILGEVVLFWFFGSAIGPRFPAFAFLMVGGGVAVMRWVAMGFSPGPVVLALCQLSHGLTFGATHLGSIALVARFAPEGARSRAQGLMSAMNGALVSAGTLASGWLFTHLGAAGFWAMVPLALAGFALAAWCAWRQPQSAREGG